MIVNVNNKGKYVVTPVIFDNRQSPTDTVYSDRLFQWDPMKYNTICMKYFGNEGQIWTGRKPKLIESFLKDYMANQNIILCRIEEDEDRMSGNPVWRFDYKTEA